MVARRWIRMSRINTDIGEYREYDIEMDLWGDTDG
jgi:hypothetical protein